MHARITTLSAGFVCAAILGATAVRVCAQDAAASQAKPPAAKPADANQPQAPGGPQGGPVFGEVVAVRGNVLQMHTPEREGLTRVILAADARIIRDETVKLDALKAGTKVSGSGTEVEGTGVGGVPLKVEVQTLMVASGGADPFGFDFGGPPPLTRGRRDEVFHKQNYSGTIGFDAQVKSVHPLILVDDEGQPLPVVLGAGVEVHQRAPHPIKEGDITAGAQVLAMGSPLPDGLLSAHMIILMGKPGDRGSMTGTIMGIDAKGLTVRPRFEPRDLLIEVVPTAKIYHQERLDLDTIQVGDVLIFSGKVLRGTAKAPESMVVQTIYPDQTEVPKIDEGGSGFFAMFGGGASVTAKVKGKIIGFDPLRVQAEDGREIAMKVPGQLTYVRYRQAERSDLKVGSKLLCAGKSKPGGLVADVLVLDPAPSLGPGF